MFRTAAALILMGLWTIASAQSTLEQAITGLVLDGSGAAISGSSVIAVNQETGVTRKARTNAAGKYEIADLPAGRYRLTCEAPGFKTGIISDNMLGGSEGIEVVFRLQIGHPGEAVSIRADGTTLDLNSGALSLGFTGDEIRQLQLNGRNYLELLSMLPGVSANYNSGFDLYGGYGSDSTSQSINGGRGDTIAFNLDGAGNKDSGTGNNFVNINPDAIGEFRVLTSSFSAEYSSSNGAVVNVGVRGGGRTYHGALYEYWRNGIFSAAPFNAAAVGKPNLRWNNFGGSFGGPVPGRYFRGRLFYFVAEDAKILRQGSTNTLTVPTAAQKSGNFGSLTIKDPVTGIAYPKNTIPASLINPNMQKLVDLFPNPNVGTASFVFNESPPTSTHQEVARVDYNLNSGNQISVNWTHDDYRQLENATQLIEYYRTVPGVTSSVTWNHLFSPTWFNVAQVAYSGNVVAEQNNVIPNPIFLNSVTRAGLGLSEPTIYNASPDIPQVAISGFSTLAATPLAFDSYNRLYTLRDDVTKVAGNHTLRAGLLFTRSRKNQDNPPAINGQYTFSTSRTPTSGQALADALLGDFYQYTESQTVVQGWFRYSQIEPYVQDDWRVTGHLTVNLGVRWYYLPPQYSALDNTVLFLPQYYSSAKASVINPSTGAVTSAPYPYNGLVLPGNGFSSEAIGRVPMTGSPAVQALFHGVPEGGAYTQWNDFAPRLGFAWDPLGRQDTVIRGGFGMSYERIPGYVLYNSVNNTPFNPSAYVLNGNVTNPAGASAGPVSVQTISNSHYLDMKPPRTLNYSLGVDRRLARNMVLSVSYVGSTASNLTYLDDINQLQPGAGVSTYIPGTKTLENTNAIRPYLGYGQIQEFTTGANFIYNSLQAQLRKTFTRSGIVNVAFTWAKARTDANSANYEPENSYNLRGDWGNSSYTRNLSLVTAYAYPLPFWQLPKTWYQQILGGWTTNGTIQIQSGLPVNLTIATDQAGTGDGNQRPNLVGSAYSGGGVGGSQILNPAAFTVPALGTLGNLGAYNIYLPNWINWNAALMKSVYRTDRLRAELRAEIFNVANHPSVTSVNTGGFNGLVKVNGQLVSATSGWGAESGTTSPRNMQFSARLIF